MRPSGCRVARLCSHSQGQGPGPIPACAGIGWTPQALEMLPLCGVHAPFSLLYCHPTIFPSP
uniref:Uncharacterized protein n=1 Tax=Anguilla anguilla TaxID=7936 RepID=A0A0E9PTD3_ANGAN